MVKISQNRSLCNSALGSTDSDVMGGSFSGGGVSGMALSESYSNSVRLPLFQARFVLQ